MTRKLLLFLCLLVTILSLSGCVGKREINDLAIVMAVGLDKGESDGMIKITAQIARPADARGQTGAPSGNTGDPIWSASAEGKSIFEAIRNLATFSSRRVFWAHNHVIVINENLAKEGIRDIIDFFTRNNELRMRTWVVVTPNKASQVVSTMTGLEVIPGEAINKLFRYSPIAGVAPRTQMIDLQEAYLSVSSEPVLARVRIIDRGVSNKKPGEAGSVEQVELAGAGVFKGDKLVGTLSSEQARGLLPFIQKVESGVVVLPCNGDKNKPITVELKDLNMEVIPSIKNGLPHFSLKLKVYANVVEAACSFSIEDKGQVHLLEKELDKKLKKNVQTVVKKAQEDFHSDFLELGKVFHNQYPAEWKKMKNRWSDIFPDTKVSISVKSEIKNSVLLYKPTEKGS